KLTLTMNPQQHPCYLRRGVWPVFSLLLALVLAGASGCGKGPPRIDGVVKHKGEPVKMGLINFFPAGGSGKERSGRIVEGSYPIIDAEPGPNIITIEVEPAEGAKRGPAELAKYAKKDTSDLKLDVKKGNQTHDINLP